MEGGVLESTPRSMLAADAAPGGAAGADAHSEARIFAILGQYAVMQVVLAGTGVVRNKVVALRLGPTAFGEISQIAAVMSVVAALVSFGMGVSLSRNAARCHLREERQEQLANANGVVLFLSALAVLVTGALLASGHFLRLAALRQDPTTAIAAALFIAAIPLGALQTNYLALLQGILDVKGLAMGRSVAVLVATAVAVPLVWFLGFIGAAIQYVLLTALVTVLLARRCRALGYAPLRARLDRGKVLVLASFGLVSVASGFGQGVADTAVRTSLIASAGSAANGLLQAPYVLAVMLKGVVLASAGSVSLATIAPKTDRQEISLAVDRLLNVILPVGVAALGLLGLLGVPAMRLLYSEAFASGVAFFPWILTADLLLVFVWVIGAPILSAGDRAIWLVLDLVHAAARWGLAVALIPSMAGLGVVVGLLGGIALHVALTLAVFRWRYRLELAPRHLGRLGFGLAFVTVLSVAGARSDAPLPLVVAGLAWLGYAAHHARQTGVLVALRSRLERG